MNIFYCNVRSVNRNIDLIEAHILNNDFHVVAHIPQLPGFDLEFVPSSSGKSGGVIMYYRKSLKVDKLHINNLPAMSHMEILSIYVKSEDVILSTIYRHPNSTMSQFLSSLEDIISQNSFQNTGKNKIFLGDFNINTLVQNLSLIHI